MVGLLIFRVHTVAALFLTEFSRKAHFRFGAQMNKKQIAAMSHPDKLGAGAKKRNSLSGDEKIPVVMSEFKRGTLHSGSGQKVTNFKQAVAIAMSEAEKRRKGNK